VRALADFDRSVEIEPTDFRNHLNRSNVLANLGRHRESLDAADRALARFPNQVGGRSRDAPKRLEASIHERRCRALLELGRFPQALEAAQRVVALVPDDAVFRHTAVDAYRAMNLPDEAREQARMSLALPFDAKDAEARVRRGVLFVDVLGDPAAGLAEFDAAVALDANVEHAQLDRGIALSALEKWEEAIRAFDAAVVRSPRGPGTWSRRGDAHLRLGHEKQAVDDFEHAFGLGFEDPGHLNAAAWVRATAKDEAVRDPAKAVDLAWRAVRAVPKDGSFWNTLGVAQCEAGAWPQALGSLATSMDLQSGGTAFDFFPACVAQARLGRAGEARALYERGVAWTAAHAPQDEELARFAAKAAAALD
jgi:tetratricopeptide (TPR) repeat protein